MAKKDQEEKAGISDWRGAGKRAQKAGPRRKLDAAVPESRHFCSGWVRSHY